MSTVLEGGFLTTTEVHVGLLNIHPSPDSLSLRAWHSSRLSDCVSSKCPAFSLPPALITALSVIRLVYARC